MSRIALQQLNSSSVNSRSARISLGPADAKRISMGGGVVGGASRRSSIVPRNSSSASARSQHDPRNISDKQFISTSVRQLVEFLLNHGYSQPINIKILSKPTNKDFYNIVDFLFRLLDPNFSFQGKIEDEIVFMFKYLQYPFPIAKSHISAVGSPHAWPHILASLVWLIELLNYQEAVEDDQQQQQQQQSSSSLLLPSTSTTTATPTTTPTTTTTSEQEEKLFFQYLAKAYACFIYGHDEQYIQLESNFIASYENTNILIKDEIETLARKQHSLQQEIEEIKHRSQLIPELDAKKRELQREQQLLNQQTTIQQQEITNYQLKIQQKEQEAFELKSNVSRINTNLAILSDKIANQEISPEDVIHMVNEQHRLQDALSQASQHRLNLEKKCVEIELALRDQVVHLEESVRMYHSLATDLKLIPKTAKNAKNENLTIELDVKTKKRETILKNNLEMKQKMIPFLQDVKKELIESTLQLRGELLQEQEVYQELEHQSQLQQESIGQWEMKVKRSETNYKREKEAFQNSVTLQQKEIDELEQQLMFLQSASTSEETRMNLASRRLSEVTTNHKQFMQQHQEQKQLLCEEIMQAINACANHREHVNTHLQTLKQQYTNRLENFFSST
jgi:kinetochore protein NDC80